MSLCSVSLEPVATLSPSLLYLHTFVYLPANDVPPSTTKQQTSLPGSPTNTARTTGANERSICTSCTSSGRGKVFLLLLWV